MLARKDRFESLKELLGDPRLTVLYGSNSGMVWTLKWASVVDSQGGVIIRTQVWSEYLEAVQLCLQLRSQSKVPKKPPQKEQSLILSCPPGTRPRSCWRREAGCPVMSMTHREYTLSSGRKIKIIVVEMEVGARCEIRADRPDVYPTQEELDEADQIADAIMRHNGYCNPGPSSKPKRVRKDAP